MENIGSFDRNRIATIAQEVQRRAKARRDFCAHPVDLSEVSPDYSRILRE